ncbi:MAG: hypothetical protein RI932_833 [Pseudomonadota bacterium]|jgi:hypothetical protein
MSVLRNQRYAQFEHGGTARDALRGLPLQQFPWVLEKSEYTSTQTELVWQLEIACLEATPSGFGTKLNFKLSGTAQLSRSSLGRHLFDGQLESRVSQLFSQDLFEIQDTSQWQCEGMLEELPKIAKELLKKFKLQVDAEWNDEKIRRQLRGHLRHSSPGGFGDRAY